MPGKRRACDSCHRRKIQCDGGLPQCNFCFHHDVACTFNRILVPRKRTPKVSGSSRKGLAKRIERMELALDAAQKTLAVRNQESREGEDSLTTSPSDPVNHRGSLHNEPSSSTNTGHDELRQGFSSASSSEKARGGARLQGSSFGTLYFAGFHVGEISSYNGIPFFSSNGHNWIRSRTGQDPSFRKQFVTGSQWHNAPHPQLPGMPGEHASNGIAELPDRKSVEHCLAAHCSSPFSRAFPIIKAEQFQLTLDLAYEPDGSSCTLESTNAKACVFSFIAFFHLSRKEHLGEINIDSAGFAGKVWALIPQIMYQSSVTGFQTLFMLAMYHMLSGDLQYGTVVHAFSCRILFALGAHAQPSQQCTTKGSVYRAERIIWLESQLRQLFWMAYTIDKEISLRTGQPPSIEDDFCDLTLPQDHRSPHLVTHSADDSSYINVSRPEFSRTTSWTTGLPGDLQLTIIKSKTCKLLYSTSALQKSDAELLRDIRQLDEELERWRHSVPIPYRPAMAFSDDMVAHNVPGADVHILMKTSITHLEYHYLAAAIHRAIGRCYDCAAGEGVSSSAAITVQASRSTLIYLRAAVDGMAGSDTAFWLLIFYPMSAVLTIFFHILMDPFNPQAEEDLNLLCTVPGLIRSLRKGPLSSKETAYFEEVDGFFTELTRLSRCAIERVSPAHDRYSPAELE